MPLSDVWLLSGERRPERDGPLYLPPSKGPGGGNPRVIKGLKGGPESEGLAALVHRDVVEEARLATLTATVTATVTVMV